MVFFLHVRQNSTKESSKFSYVVTIRQINESEFLSMAPMLPMDPAFMLVADFFRRKHVHVTSNWIRECIRFCKQESLVPPGSTIDKAVYVQWMIADIRHPGVQDYSIRLRRLPGEKAQL